MTAHVQPMSCDEAYFELPSAVDVEGVVAGLRRRIVDATGRGRVLVCAPPLLLRLGPWCTLCGVHAALWDRALCCLCAAEVITTVVL